jgi:hypothetical protein
LSCSDRETKQPISAGHLFLTAIEIDGHQDKNSQPVYSNVRLISSPLQMPPTSQPAPQVVILGAARPPIGKFGGAFKDVHAAELGAFYIWKKKIRAARRR